MKKRAGLFVVFLCAQTVYGMEIKQNRQLLKIEQKAKTFLDHLAHLRNTSQLKNPSLQLSTKSLSFSQKLNHLMYTKTLKKMKHHEIKKLSANYEKHHKDFYATRLEWGNGNRDSLEKIENCIQKGKLATNSYEKLSEAMLEAPFRYAAGLKKILQLKKNLQESMNNFYSRRREILKKESCVVL